ncbi:hypothetical protein, partial [Aliikangiella maris]
MLTSKNLFYVSSLAVAMTLSQSSIGAIDNGKFEQKYVKTGNIESQTILGNSELTQYPLFSTRRIDPAYQLETRRIDPAQQLETRRIDPSVKVSTRRIDPSYQLETRRIDPAQQLETRRI